MTFCVILFPTSFSQSTTTSVNNKATNLKTSTEEESYSISNVVLDPTSPATLYYGEKVHIDFDYEKPDGDVYIFCEAMKDGSDVTQYNSGSSTYTDNTGEGNTFFYFISDEEVDQIRLFMEDAESREVLYEKYIDVNYTFQAHSGDISEDDYSISNIVLDPTSSDTLTYGQYVNLDFDYGKPDGPVLIFVQPMKDGSKVSGASTSGSSTYKDNSGSADGSFSFTKDAEVDQIRIQMQTPGYEVLYTKYIDVDYTFVEKIIETTEDDYSISNIVLDPTSPDTLTYGKKVNIEFDYEKPDGDDILIFCEAMKDGEDVTQYCSGSSTYSANTGEGDAFFYFIKDAEVDQIRLFIEDAESREDLYETFVDVDYTWRSSTTSIKSNTIESIQLYPNPAQNYFYIESVDNEKISVEIINTNGHIVKQLDSEENKSKIGIEQLSKGMYFVKITNAQGDITTKKLIKH